MRIEKMAARSVLMRLDGMLERPSLYNDRMMPSRVRSRLRRVESWLGKMGVVILRDPRGERGLTGTIRRQWTDDQKINAR